MVNDRLYDELLKPIVEDYYETAKRLGQLLTVPALEGTVRVVAGRERLEVLEGCGDRTADVLGVAEPLWEDMRGMAGLSW